MINLWFILFSSYFFAAANGKLKKTIYYFKGTTTVYEYFFAETFTVANFIDSA